MEFLIVIIGTIVGILLGWRFKVFVLLPAILIAAGVIITTGHGLKVIALTLLSTVVLLQIGYFVGAYLRAGTQPDSRPDPRQPQVREPPEAETINGARGTEFATTDANFKRPKPASAQPVISK